MSNRRDFLKTSAAVGGIAVAGNLAAGAFVGGGDTIKVGLIGCGGRGRGAVRDILNAEEKINGANPKVEIVAIGDVFKNRTESAAKAFKSDNQKSNYRKYLGQMKFTPETTFDGLDAYKKVLAADVDLVILATPPGFRPIHLEAAIKAKKHIFCEKPVAVDATGARKVYGLVDESKKQNIAIVAGTQRRHQKGYIETIKKLNDKAIGDIVAARCYWNNSGIWFRDRQDGQKDGADPINTWYTFPGRCWDPIVTQHLTNPSPNPN